MGNTIIYKYNLTDKINNNELTLTSATSGTKEEFLQNPLTIEEKEELEIILKTVNNNYDLLGYKEVNGKRHVIIIYLDCPECHTPSD